MVTSPATLIDVARPYHGRSQSRRTRSVMPFSIRLDPHTEARLRQLVPGRRRFAVIEPPVTG